MKTPRTPSLPLLGGQNIVDLNARAANKRLRELTAQGIAKNRALVAQCDLLGDTLAEAVELLKEARDILAKLDSPGCSDLAARITARLGA